MIQVLAGEQDRRIATFNFLSGRGCRCSQRHAAEKIICTVGRPLAENRYEVLFMASQSNNPYGELDRGILQAIGLAVIKFSHLEEDLVLGVTCLLVGKRYDEAVDFMVRKLHFQGLLDTFGGLYRHRYPNDDFRDLKEVCNQLEDLNDERNHLFHSLWTSGEAADQLRRYRMKVIRAGPKIWDMSFKEADILRFAEQADQVRERLVLFVAERILQRIDEVIAKARGKQLK